MKLLAFDIGGANVKVADGRGYAAHTPFPLWKTPDLLAEVLKRCLVEAPSCDAIALTMTGELADCFTTKVAGIQTIVANALEAFSRHKIFVYLVDGRLVEPHVALQEPLLAAASNWHCLSSFAAQYCKQGTGVLLDAGSTTVDLIPIREGRPVPSGIMDPERLASRELVYTGVQRSPVCAIVRDLPWRGLRCSVAQEYFATAGDAYLLLGLFPEEPENCDTADGRPRTQTAAHSRMARMVCADSTLVSLEDAKLAASEVMEAQLQMLHAAYDQVTSKIIGSVQRIIVCGQGEFLLHHLLNRVDAKADVVSLASDLGQAVSSVATAHALAVLAREKCSP